MPIPIKWFSFFCIAIIIIGIPRFDRLDRFGLDQFTTGGKPAATIKSDADHYQNLVLFFRGEISAELLREPWAYRPLVPLLAASLPFHAMTSINIINYISLIAGLFFLLKVFLLLKFSTTTSLVGAALYSFSFPVFYYSTIGYLDPFIIFWIILILYFILTNKNAAFIILFLVGGTNKDLCLFVLPVWALHQILTNKKPLLSTLLLTLSLFIYVVFLTRLFIPVDTSFYHLPSLQRAIYNLSNERFWLSSLLTVGIPGIFALLQLATYKAHTANRNTFIVLVSGLACSLSIFVYAIFAAYADGRFLWLIYPFLLPLACMYIDRLFTPTFGCALKRSFHK